MKNLQIVLGLIFFVLLIPVYDAYAHSLFNSAEEFIGGYRVQIATLPEFPQIDENSMILLRVTDANFTEVDEFTMGIRFTYHGQQIQEITPRLIKGSHYDINFIFRNSGNYIVYVDLYGVDEKISTFTFNIGTQSPFGYIFFIAITIGAMTFAIIIGYIYLPKRFRS